MARPIKTGIDYYPLDVNFLQDIKIRKIMRACGIQSITILISLLSSIYRDEGYYVVWDEDMSFLVADEVGASEGAVREVVKKAVQVDFFSEHVFEKYKVLTSAGIQERYLQAVNRRKRIELISEYLVVNLDSVTINLDNVYINSINVGRSTQRKGKERKVKDSKEKNSKKTNTSTSTVSSEEISSIAKIYQDAGFLVDGLTADWIKDSLKIYGFEWMKNAILEAANYGARNRAYVNKILSNWKSWGGMRLAADKPNKSKEQDINMPDYGW